MQEKNIKSLRKEIDSIDDQLLELINQRTSIVDKLGILKKDTNNIVDKKREAEIISRLLNLHKGNFSRDSIARIWREIFHTSANIQLKKNNILHSKRGVDSIKLYKGGVSKVQGIEKIIKLSSNESPFGPSKKAQEAYQKVSDKLSRYPELTAESLQNAIAEKHNLKSDRIICGTGSDEVLIFTVLTFCSPGDEVIHAQHGFEMYPILAKYAGAESVLASEIDYKVSIDSIINNINDSTKVIFIANPNNPTGTYLNKNELRLLMSKIPSNIVAVIDTAYAEFADADDYDKTFSLVDEYSNVLITRTFSKAYSLAGLRLGWGYASDLLINMIKKLRPPFNLSQGAIAAGIAALNDENHIKKAVNHNSSIKFWFIDELNNLGLKAYNTQANFVFVLIPNNENQNAKLINDYLLSKGIAVRYLLSYGLENALRITLGTKEELNKTIEVLKEFRRNNG
jgi:histidinol-phosphate aminotransferase